MSSVYRRFTDDCSPAHAAPRMLLLIAGSVTALSAMCYAGPDKHTVVRGNVKFIFDGDKTIIKASDGSIINFDAFNIDADEIVKFVQPDDLARVLNRVTGSDPSIIAGTLLSNGQVYIVNPAGVYFTDGAIVDVGGLYAAAGHIADQDFVDSIDRFTNLAGEVINTGSITTDRVHFLGSNVANHGDIKAKHGVIAMLAGDKILLKEHDGRIIVKVDGVKLSELNAPIASQTTPNLDANPGVENTGTLRARQGKIMLGAGDMYALAVRNAGTVRARGGNVSVEAADGAIHNSGSIDVGVHHGEAGTVDVFAPAIVNEGTIAADAAEGQAGKITMLSDSHTFLLDGSEVSASGGNGVATGGEIVINTLNGVTEMSAGAAVNAHGAEHGGHGGFAEISGELLIFNGDINLHAPEGFDHGTLLLDPGNITINDTGADDSYMADGQITFNEPDLTADISISDEALEAVTGHIMLQADDNIFVNQEVDLLYDNDLTMLANSAIVMNETITGANDMTLIADCDNNNFGDLSLMAPMSITGRGHFQGHTIFLAGGTLDSGGSQSYLSPVDLCFDVMLSATQVHFESTVNATNAAVEALTINGPVTFAGEVGAQRELRLLEVNGPATIGGTLVRTADSQLYNDTVSLTNDSQFVSLDSGIIQFNGAVNGHHDMTICTAGTTLFADTVGSAAPLDALTTDAPGETRIGGDMHAISINFNDPVTLDADISISASQSVEFAASITGAQFDLDITSPLTSFQSDITDIDHLHTDADGVTAIGANIGGNALEFDDAVTFQSDSLLAASSFIEFGQTLDGGYNVTAASDGTMQFAGDVGSYDPLASIVVNAGGVIHFDGEFVGADGDIQINPGGIADIPQVATISSSGDMAFNSLNGDFIMGQHQKLTAMGDLIIDVAGTAQLGDLNSLGNTSVQASTIELLTRNAASVMNHHGVIKNDFGLDYVAGGSIFFSVVPTSLGAGPSPRFATATGPDSVSGTLGSFDVVALGPLNAGQFMYGETILDLRAMPLELQPPNGDSSPASPNRAARLAEALGGSLLNPGDRLRRDPFVHRILERLAIEMRSATPDELAIASGGIELYDDSGAQRDAAPRTNLILANRMRGESVIAALARAQHIFHTDPVTGEPSDHDQGERIRMIFTHAWDSYTGLHGVDAATAGFRAFLETTPDFAEANAYVHDLRLLLRDVKIMGVTPLEYQVTRSALLDPLTPSSMRPQDFYALIEGT